MRNSLLILCFFMISCTGKQGYLKYSATHPEVLAADCLEQFPVKESFIKGKTDTLINYTVLEADSIACPTVEGKSVTYIKVPVNSVKTLYISRTDTLIKRDSSALFLLMKSQKKTQEQYDEIYKLKSQKGSLIVWLVLACLSVIGLFYITMIK